MTLPVGWQIGVVIWCVVLALSIPALWRFGKTHGKEFRRVTLPNWKTRWIVWRRNRNAPKEAARQATESVAQSNAHIAAVSQMRKTGVTFNSKGFAAGPRELQVGDTLTVSWPIILAGFPGTPHYTFVYRIVRTGANTFEIEDTATTPFIASTIPNPTLPPKPPPPEAAPELSQVMSKRKPRWSEDN